MLRAMPQIVPDRWCDPGLQEIVADRDRARAQRAGRAMQGMTTLDLAAPRAAALAV
jgi:hypothetical protein